MTSRTRSSDAPAPAHTPCIRRVACITTSRADAGAYAPLLSSLSESASFDVLCLAGGTHASERFGRTMEQLPSLPRVRTLPVAHHVEGDTPEDAARSVGQAVTAFSAALAEVKPDLAFVLGDRTEMLGAALAALIHRVPIAHLHGGDATFGAYDEQCRHAVTKLSHVHFCALPEHATRIAAMGEEPWRIHTVGALALDAAARFIPETAADLGRRIGLDFREPTIVLLFHAETLSPLPAQAQVEALVAALVHIEANLLIVAPNADPGRERIAAAWSALAARRKGVACVTNLAQRDFWSCLAHARALVGNSSAGIIEAATFKLPVVNVGDRQAGRLRAANVIDAPIEPAAIRRAITRAMDDEFHASLTALRNPWGDGRAVRRILNALGVLPDRQSLLLKKWHGPD